MSAWSSPLPPICGNAEGGSVVQAPIELHDNVAENNATSQLDAFATTDVEHRTPTSDTKAKRDSLETKGFQRNVKQVGRGSNIVGGGSTNDGDTSLFGGPRPSSAKSPKKKKKRTKQQHVQVKNGQKRSLFSNAIHPEVNHTRKQSTRNAIRNHVARASDFPEMKHPN
jgi:hypothetical protein